MRSRGGTLRAQWLGKLLRDLRESNGLSLKDAGDHVLRDPSAISRIESGSTPARVADVRELMNLYGVDDPELRSGLELLARDIWVKDWWDGYTGNVHVRVLDLAWLEARAEKIRNFSPMVIHGLLQTRDYAEAIMRIIKPDVSETKITQWIEFRMKRQDVLHQQDYTAILDEGVFQRSFGGAPVMREQLAHLLELYERPNVTIRVLPFIQSPLACPESAFTLLTMPAPFPVVAQATTDTGAIYVEMPRTARFEAAYARYERHALDTEDSRVYIKSRMEQLA
ncbi:MAG TPA: helix-turn-helix transcriptional regulator [Micromonosporaceae bacterium]